MMQKAAPSHATVEVQNIVKSFGATRVVDGLSFDIQPGECVALLGPSGCGKTTTLRLLAGFEQPQFGTIRMDGRDVLRLKPYERNVGLVFQDYALFPHMSVAENIAYGMRRRGVAGEALARRLDELIALVRLSGLEHRRPAELSGGQQQRVAIARALAPRPTLLLLDEPLSNLDTKLRLALRQGLRAILSATGATTLLVTHDQEEAMAMSDRIVVLDKGRCQQAGTPAHLYNYPANRFVAEFLGPCLFLAAERDEPNHDGVQAVRLADGSALRAVPPPGRLLPSSGLGVMVRPARMRLRPADAKRAEDMNALAAMVIARDFLGESTDLTLQLAGDVILNVREPPSGDPTPIGAKVIVEFPPEACLLIPEQSA